jgi:hypothetical protein
MELAALIIWAVFYYQHFECLNPRFLGKYFP